MSGGSLNYAFMADGVQRWAYEQAIAKLEASNLPEAAEMLHKALRAHDEAYALHCNAREILRAVEWTLSGDSTEEDLKRICGVEVQKYVVPKRTAYPRAVAGDHLPGRTPDGSINNCALANGDVEENCQMCRNRCPDRARY